MSYLTIENSNYKSSEFYEDVIELLQKQHGFDRLKGTQDVNKNLLENPLINFPAREIFVAAHGINPRLLGTLINVFTVIPSLLLIISNPEHNKGMIRRTLTKLIPGFSLISSLFSSTITIENLISSVIKKTHNPKDINIIHLFSCKSQAAQNCLEKIKGNILLCTYSGQEESVIPDMTVNFSYDRMQTSDNLVDFMIKNLHLLAASNFSISYKLDGIIYNYTINSDNIKNLNNTKEVLLFLKKEYNNLKNFYNGIYEKFYKKYPDIFPNYTWHDTLEYSEGQITIMLTRLLIQETFNNPSINNVNLLLEKGAIADNTAIENAIKNKKSEIIDRLLNHPSAKISSDILTSTIYQGNLEVLKILLNHPSAKISSDILTSTIYQGNLEALKILLNHPSVKISSDILESTIYQGNPEALKILLNHPSAKISDFTLYFAVERGSLEILKILSIHALSTEDHKTLTYFGNCQPSTITSLYCQATNAEDFNISIPLLELKHTTTSITYYQLIQTIAKNLPGVPQDRTCTNDTSHIESNSWLNNLNKCGGVVLGNNRSI